MSNSINMRVNSVCPYCSTKNADSLVLHDFKKKHIVNCEPEEDGCNKEYVVDVRVVVDSAPLSIGGEGK